MTFTPTPTGVAVRVEDGVVALDGDTGEEVWSYRREGAYALSIGASPSGTWVMATFGTDNDAGGGRLMAFDGQTGEIGFDELTAGGPFGGVKLDLTDDVLIGGSPDDGRFTGFALEDGSELWNWAVPDDCYLGGSRTLSFAARTTVVLPLVCADDEQQGADGITGEVIYLSLNSQTGSEEWRVADEFTDTEPLNDGNSSLYHRVFIEADIRVSGDGALARLSWQARGAENPITFHLVDTTTGDELSADESVIRTTSFERSIVSESPPGTINYVSDDDEYVLAPFNDPDDERTIGSRCTDSSSPLGAGHADAWVNVGDALVELCAPVNFDEGTPFPMGVTPWDDPDQAYDFEVDLGSHVDDPVVSSTYLAKFPAVTVALSGIGTQLTALGQP